MKKIIAIMSIIAVMGAFTACSNGESESIKDSSSLSSVSSEAESKEDSSEVSSESTTGDESSEISDDENTSETKLPSTDAPMGEINISSCDLDETVYMSTLDILKGACSMNFTYDVSDDSSKESIDYEYVSDGKNHYIACSYTDGSESYVTIDGIDYLLFPESKEYVNVSEEAVNKFMEEFDEEESSTEIPTATTEDSSDADEHECDENCEHSEDEEMVVLYDPYEFFVTATPVSADNCEIDGVEYYRVKFDNSENDDENAYYAYFDKENTLTYTAVTSVDGLINLRARDISFSTKVDKSLLVIPEDYKEISVADYFNKF